MNIGVDLELVVGHLECLIVRAEAQDHAILAFLAQHDALLEIRRIHRVRKIHRCYDFLRRRVGGILIKLRFSNFRHKWRGAEFHAVVLQAHLLGNQALLRQRHHHLGAHRPVGFGIQTQRAVVLPFPCALYFGFDGNARRDVLPHPGERGHRIAEFDHQRLRLGVGLIHCRRFRNGDFIRHFQRLGLFVVPDFSRSASRDHRHTHRAGNRRAPQVCAHPTRESDAAESHRVADAAHPPRRLPSHVADEGPQYAAHASGGRVRFGGEIAHGNSFVTNCFY